MELGALRRLGALFRGRPPLAVDRTPSPRTIHLEINRLNRLVFIVVRGNLTMSAARAAIDQLATANVPHFAKIIDISGLTSDLEPRRLRRLVARLRAPLDFGGRVALVVDGKNDCLRDHLTQMIGDNPRMAIFRTLHAARVFVHRELNFDELSQAAD